MISNKLRFRIIKRVNCPYLSQTRAMTINSFDDISTKWHFKVLTTTYKTLTSKKGTVQPIKVDVWLPPNPLQKTTGHPVILFLHGGGLYAGSRSFAPYINGWLPGFAQRHNAVVVAPDYRLIPESTGQDIIDDLEDFFYWTVDTSPSVAKTKNSELSTSLSSFLATQEPGVKVDSNHIIATGGSAGSYCAVHLALSHSDPSKGPYIRSLFLQYPFVDIDCPWTQEGNPEYNEASTNPAIRPLGREPLTPEKFREFEESVRVKREAGEILTGFDGFVRPASSGQYYGRWGSWILEGQRPSDRGGPRDVVVFRRVTEGKDVSFPRRTVIIHGSADSAVPVQSTHDLVKLVKERFPDSETHVEVFDGLEHGFDASDEIVNSPRIQEDLEWAAEAWLS